MDCARTALRTAGVEHVTLVYRRTEPFMPAAQEDVDAVRAEGIEVLELLAPVAYDGAVLRCEHTELAAWTDDGRRSTRGTGSFVDLAFDTVIGATGATVDTGPYRANGVAVDEHGLPRLGPGFRASVAGGVTEVYTVGDGRVGPDTVVRALADAKTVARAILRHHGIPPDFDRAATAVFTAHDVIVGRRGLLLDQVAGPREAARCLRCDEVCEICTEVCPNRANVAVTVPGFADERQVVHVDGLCNECGNCGTFCPLAGLPYRDKVTVFWSRHDFEASPNVGFLRRRDDYLVRLPSGDVVTHRRGDDGLPVRLERLLAVLEAEYAWLLDTVPAEPAEEVTT
jgi:putative selenate reductase